MNSNEAEETIAKNYIGRKLRVRTKNDRSFEGKLMGVDYQANIILHEAVATIPSALNCPLNYQLENAYDIKLQPPVFPQLSPEEREKAVKEYMGSHFYFGSIMITGSDIAQI
jgi:small nuclear ribonucleoprotein (snRNP)-like protein